MWPNEPRQDTTADDAVIYKAIIDHTIRPEVSRFDKGAGIESPRILIVNRTLASCQPYRPSPARLGCVEIPLAFENDERGRPPIFDGLITEAVRDALAKSLLARNDQNYSFPFLEIGDVLFADPEQIDPALKRLPPVTTGFASFSRPAFFDPRDASYVIGNQKHTAQRQALVYVTYFCGGSCGYGWFFLLEHRGGEWRVQSRAMLWIA
jgi:hypothetical protein